MPGVRRTEVFDVDAESFYEVVTDYASYPEFVDGVQWVEVHENNDSGARAEFHARFIKDFYYLLELEHVRPNHVRWSLVSGNLFKKNEGSWELHDLDEGGVEVKYAVDVQFTIMAPKPIVNRVVKHNLPVMLNQFYQRTLDLYYE